MLQRFYQPILILPLVLMLSGCFATPGVRYDESLVQNLNQVSVETLTFFASIKDGTQAEKFIERKQHYFRLLGQYEGLEIQATSRPYTKPDSLDRVSQSSTPTQLPSVTALQNIYKTLLHMKQTDQQQGLTKTEVAVYKLQTRTYLDQIITFEQHLKPY
ncbi:MAG: hypothetical protein U9R28_11855 [Pseudomonadota bacterium]|nr:hypothetical protein [Pseudomonadota bacterium]